MKGGLMTLQDRRTCAERGGPSSLVDAAKAPRLVDSQSMTRTRKDSHAERTLHKDAQTNTRTQAYSKHDSRNAAAARDKDSDKGQGQ